MKRLVTLALCLLLVLCFGFSAVAEDTIKIGALLSFTGGAPYESKMLEQGYKFAADYWNSVGGIKSMGGKKIEFVFADHADDPEIGKTEFERLRSEGCVMFTGDYSSGNVVIALQPLLARYKIPFVVSQQSFLDIYTEDNKWVVNPTNDAATNAQGLVGVVKMVEEKFGSKIDGVAFLAQNNEWGQSQIDSFEKYFEEGGVPVSYKEMFEPGSSDFSVQIQKMKAAGVKFVVPCISNFNDAVTLFRQCKEYEFNPGWLCCGGVIVTKEFQEALGETNALIFSTDTWNPGFLPARGEKALAIHQTYVDKFGYNMNENAGCAWNAVAVIVAALEAAGTTDGATVMQSLYDMDLPEDSEYMIMTSFEGMKFGYPDTNGIYGHNIYGYSSISQLIDGQWCMVWPDRLLGENNPIQWPQ